MTSTNAGPTTADAVKTVSILAGPITALVAISIISKLMGELVSSYRRGVPESMHPNTEKLNAFRIWIILNRNIENRKTKL